MVMDHVVDIADDSGHLWLKTWRCLSCGDVVDPQILRRRLIKAAGPAPVVELFPKKPEQTPDVEPAQKPATAKRSKKSAEPGRMSA
jgi:hypothetical protein